MRGQLRRDSQSQLIARIVAAALRRGPISLSVTPEELQGVTPLLLTTGTAALAWHLLRSLGLPLAGPVLDLPDAYRKNLIDAAVHDLNTNDIFKRAAAAGIEPILFKGWALARLYPDSGLRPY